MAFAYLHLPTLFLVTAMAIGFSGVVLVLVSARDRGRGSIALMIWGAAMIVGASGIICLALEPVRGQVAASAGDVLIILGTALSWTAARAFDGRRPRPGLVLASPAVWLLWSVAPVAKGPMSAPILAMLLGSAYTFATARELWEGRNETLRSRNIAVVLLLLHGAIYLGRAAYETVRLRHQGHANDISAALMIEALLHTIAMAFLLLALAKERAELRVTESLGELASRDGLTGLRNRRAFDAALEHEFRHAVREGAPLGLLMIDVDYFKSYNDLYGHRCGDDCLRAIASAIQSAARDPADVGVRYGGDECAMLLPRTDQARAAHVAETILANVTAMRIEHAGSPHGRVGVSIGVAVISPGEEATSPVHLVEAADSALYGAKTAGRNQLRVAGR